MEHVHPVFVLVPNGFTNVLTLVLVPTETTCIKTYKKSCKTPFYKQRVNCKYIGDRHVNKVPSSVKCRNREFKMKRGNA